MPRFILIDMHSGLVFGDTANIQGEAHFPATALEAARLVDTLDLGEYGRSYSEVTRAGLMGRTGYLVYQAESDGPGAFPAITDGGDLATIQAVQISCPFVCAVLCEREPVLADLDYI